MPMAAWSGRIATMAVPAPIRVMGSSNGVLLPLDPWVVKKCLTMIAASSP